ncbi:MAG: hypothetical protein KatS3mg105_2219 [Gemmatales bacterium]|nr:MAG: hypothetical protein KatS3mg105_2219 [Gemmatales bacterium]
MMAEMGNATPGRLNPNALTLADAARLLAKAGGWKITKEMIEADIAAGAPTNADGTINLVHYAAWLVKGLLARLRFLDAQTRSVANLRHGLDGAAGPAGGRLRVGTIPDRQDPLLARAAHGALVRRAFGFRLRVVYGDKECFHLA